MMAEGVLMLKADLDALRAENARLQALVAAMELAHSLVRDKLEDERDDYKVLAERMEPVFRAALDANGPFEAAVDDLARHGCDNAETYHGPMKRLCAAIDATPEAKEKGKRP
jgi:hypothetical protein